LKLSVENGCLEYKLSLVNSIFRQLQNERYKSLPAATLDSISRDLGIIVYVATIQRLLAEGHLPLRAHQKQPDEESATGDLANTEVKEIISEIQQRVKDDPDLRTKQPVKNILMQLSRYNKEMNEFRELTARIPKDKAPAVAVNFRKTTDEIYASIRRNYEQLLADEQAAVPKEPQHILMRIDLKSMAPVYQRQAKEAAAVRSALHLAREEQYGTRESIIKQADRHGDFEKLIDAEQRRYEELGGTSAVAREIAKAFRSEISKRIQREIEYY
ncbi:MAG: hypothetical protein V3S41_03940, partial [Spirochaetia bacterium]